MEQVVNKGTVVNTEEEYIEVLMDDMGIVENFHKIECHRFNKIKLMDRVYVTTTYEDYTLPNSRVELIVEE